MMATLGATRDMWKLRANDRVLLESILTDIVEVPAERLRDVSSVVDRWEKYPREALAIKAAEIGVSDKQFDRLVEALTSGPGVLEDISQDARDRSYLMKVLNSSSGELITFDPLIVRAFEYYTSTVFEVFDTDPTNNRSLFGGGRYTNLAGLFTAQQIPGIGFGMGDVTLHDFLGTHGLLPGPRSEIDVVVIPIDEALVEPARDVARQLRVGTLRTSTPLEHRKLGKELARADKAGAQVVVIIGAEEWASGSVLVRDMTNQEQHQVPVGRALQAVLAVMNGPQPLAS
jgi:histidyl-tRNA synthetase